MEIIALSIPSRPQSRPSLTRYLIAIIAMGLTGCATPPPVAYTPRQHLELRSSPAVSTIHFPAGVYVLSSEDNSGFYYAAPGGVVKHSFAGPQRYDGGLFLDRRNPRKLRGYIIWAGGVTKIGDLSRQPYSFRD